MCVSSRRRPITSPPGGGIVARPVRARSGPASRNDARMRRQSSSSGSDLTSSAAWTWTSFGPTHSASAPRSASRSTIVSTSRMRGTLCSVTASPVSSVRRQDRERAVLVPGRAHRAGERVPALDHEGRAVLGDDRGLGHRRDACRPRDSARTAGYRTRRRGTDTRARLGDPHPLHGERRAAQARARGRGRGAGVRAEVRRGRGALGRHRAPARLRLGDAPDARAAPAGRRADPARGGLARRGDRGDPLPRRAPEPPARHAAQEDAVRVRRALGLHRRVRATCARPGSTASR